MMLAPGHFVKKSNWLIALLIEALAPALRSYARYRTGAARMAPHQWRRALILGDNHIGDLLYRTCSLKTLKTGLPDCDLYYLTAADTAAVLAGNPYLKAVLPWVRSDSSCDLEPGQLATLASMRFDVALCTNCIRYWPDLLLAVRLGIPHRVCYSHKGFSGWITHPVPIHIPQPFPAYFRDYVATLCGETISNVLRPEVFPGADAEAAAASAWRRMGLEGPSPVIAFFLTSRQDTALWPMSSFQELFDMIVSSLQARIVLLGASGDREFLGACAHRSPVHPPVCAGELDLLPLAAFIKRCALVIAKDSGPRHIANAVGTKVLFFRNALSSQVETGPYSATEEDLMPPGEFLNKRRQQDLLAGITPSMIFQRIELALRERTGQL